MKLNLKHPLLIILALFLLGKIFLLMRFHDVGWDEAVYLGMGKYIYSLGSSGLWESLRPLGLPVVIGWMWKLGLPYVLLSELIAVLFAAGNIILTYSIGKRVFDRNVGLLAAALLAISPVFFNHSSAILTEIPSTFFAMASINFLIGKRYYLSGGFAALAMLFKFPHGIILGAFIITALLDVFKRRESFVKRVLPSLKAIGSFAVVTVPFLIFNYLFYNPYIHNAFKAATFTFNQASWHQSNPAKAIANPIINYSFYLVTSLQQHVLMLLLPLAVLLFFRQKWFKDKVKLFLSVYALLYFAYFSWIINKDYRFLLLFFPIFCIFAAASFFASLNFLRSKASLRSSRLLALGKIALVSLLVLSFVIAVSVDAVVVGWTVSSKQVTTSHYYRLPENLSISGTILVPDPTFAAYSDNLFYHYYDLSGESLLGGLYASNPWERSMPVSAIIYSTDAIGCQTAQCEQQKLALLQSMRGNFTEIFNSTSPWVSRYVFATKS